MADRRFPERRPLARPLGNIAQIREAITTDRYLIHILSGPLSPPEIAFYSGSRVLLPGERVSVTWREETRLWEISTVADIRIPPGEGGLDTPQDKADAAFVTYAPGAGGYPAGVDTVAEALDELADRWNPTAIPLPLNSSVAVVGAPVFGGVGTNLVAWAFGDAATEEIKGAIPLPPTFGSAGTFRLFFAMATAVAGSVVWRVTARGVTTGQNAEAAGTAQSETIVVPGTAGFLRVSDVVPATTYSAGQLLRYDIARLGADAADTATGDAWLLGVEFIYDFP